MSLRRFPAKIQGNTTLKNVSIITSRIKRIVADLQMGTYLKCVRLHSRILKKNASKEMIASGVTTEWKTFTTLRSTKPSSARPTPIKLASASTEVFVPLHITSQNSALTFWIRWIEIQTFTFSTSRRCGAPFQTKSISATSACMLTIGKITAVLLTSMNTRTHNANVGKLRRILEPTKMVADKNTGVGSAMVGKSSNTTLSFIRRQNVESLKGPNVAKLTVLITILRVKRGHLCRIMAFTTSCFLEIGELHLTRLIYTSGNHCSDYLLM